MSSAMVPSDTDPRRFPRGFRDHRRSFEDNRYVYPVLSRRSGGISIGINLNPDKICNMDCIYCQVDRETPPTTRQVDLTRLHRELEDLIEDVSSGRLFTHPRFRETPPALRRLNDIAFSGDGEPTTFKPFDSAVEVVVALKRERGLREVKVVLITDSGCLHHDHVKRGLEIMDAHQGQVWAKLDAGTEAMYRHVNRTAIPFRRVLRNLAECVAVRPIVIQSLFMAIAGEGPSEVEIAAYIDRLQTLEATGTLEEVHIYTVARQPAEPFVAALDCEIMDAIAHSVAARVKAPVRTFYGG